MTFSLLSLYQSSSGVSSKVLDDYCWVHSTFHIRTEYQVYIATKTLSSEFLFFGGQFVSWLHQIISLMLNPQIILKILSSSHMVRSWSILINAVNFSYALQACYDREQWDALWTVVFSLSQDIFLIHSSEPVFVWLNKCSCLNCKKLFVSQDIFLIHSSEPIRPLFKCICPNWRKKCT